MPAAQVAGSSSCEHLPSIRHWQPAVDSKRWAAARMAQGPAEAKCELLLLCQCTPSTCCFSCKTDRGAQSARGEGVRNQIISHCHLGTFCSLSIWRPGDFRAHWTPSTRHRTSLYLAPDQSEGVPPPNLLRLRSASPTWWCMLRLLGRLYSVHAHQGDSGGGGGTKQDGHLLLQPRARTCAAARPSEGCACRWAAAIFRVGGSCARQLGDLLLSGAPTRQPPNHACLPACPPAAPPSPYSCRRAGTPEPRLQQRTAAPSTPQEMP